VPVQTVLVLEAVIVLLSPKHAFSGPNPSVFGASWAASHRLLLLPPPELARRLREVRVVFEGRGFVGGVCCGGVRTEVWGLLHL
jgi:hypothetical protein